MKISPQVSVIIPFFEREDFLREAVESVLNQTYRDWEIVLIDDGSSDTSPEIAQSFVADYPDRISFFQHPGNKNLGASASRNLGIQNARGRYITFLDSDDVFYEDTLERELLAFESNPGVDVVCGTLKCWYSWSPAAESWEKDFVVDLVLDLDTVYEPPDLFVHNLGTGGSKPGINCVMVTREFAEKYEVFAEDYKYAWEDQVFWAKVSLNARIFVMDAVLSNYRQHPASTCAVESVGGRDIESMMIFLKWLEGYVERNNSKDGEVRAAFNSFRRKVHIEMRVKPLKQVYRKVFSLELRYRIRDTLTRIKKSLLWSSHRHK
jgi:glycosyltransferase involved in cell wall biosynthesis